MIVIGFILIDSSYTTYNIYKHILSIVEKYGIRNRIIAITLDNTTTNTKVIPELEGLVGSYNGIFLLHQRYICHIINFIVKSKYESDR